MALSISPPSGNRHQQALLKRNTMCRDHPLSVPNVHVGVHGVGLGDPMPNLVPTICRCWCSFIAEVFRPFSSDLLCTCRSFITTSSAVEARFISQEVSGDPTRHYPDYPVTTPTTLSLPRHDPVTIPVTTPTTPTTRHYPVTTPVSGDPTRHYNNEVGLGVPLPSRLPGTLIVHCPSRTSMAGRRMGLIRVQRTNKQGIDGVSPGHTVELIGMNPTKHPLWTAGKTRKLMAKRKSIDIMCQTDVWINGKERHPDGQTEKLTARQTGSHGPKRRSAK